MCIRFDAWKFNRMLNEIEKKKKKKMKKKTANYINMYGRFAN